jgi:hypothetical protein
MIRCTIVETTAQGGETASRVARATLSETLTLGRAAACKIYLPAPQVRLEHASIRRSENGYLLLEGIGGAVLVDGQLQDLVRLALEQVILIGPFEFVVTDLTHGPDCPQPLLKLRFTHKPVQAIPLDTGASNGGFRRSLVGMRSLTWLAALAFTVALILLPLWQAYEPQELAIGGPPPVKLDAMWNPGPISSAHKNIGNQCKNCHTKPFQRVRDLACVSCHKASGPHIPAHATLQAKVFEGQRCASCHREHQGEDGMKKVDAVGCELCHSNVRAVAPTAALPNVGDFGTEHPDFLLTMKVSSAPDVLRRFAHTPALKEASGLKFPHDAHLSILGIRSPKGPTNTSGRVVLQCNSCHQLDSAKVRFQPVRMEQACISCHQLGIDAQSPTRQVPHGQPQAVVMALRDSFSALALEKYPSQVVTVNSLLQGPQIAAAKPLSSSAARWVHAKTLAAATDMFENPKGTCLTCHSVERLAGKGADDMPSWKVQPVLGNDHWLPKSKFSHAQHNNAACSACHGAGQSSTSADILIPPISTCRTCHVGTHQRHLNTALPDKVISQCNSCHDFHSPVVHASFSAAKARAAGPAPAASAP